MLPDAMQATRKPPFPGLFSWQVLFLAFAAGIFALRFPVPASCGALLVWGMLRICTGRSPALLVFVACFVLGWGYAAWRFPAEPGPPPEWMLARQKVMVRGRVDSVRFKPDGRMQLILGDVGCTPAGGTEERLGGRLVWTWQYPEYVPAPGQKVEVRTKVSPVRGFLVPGAWDTRFYWACRGVPYRAYSRGNKARAAFGPRPPDFLFGLRLGLAERIGALAPHGQGQAVLKALLLGDRSGLRPETVEAMRSASLAHSLALSGLHVGIVVCFGLFLARLVGRLYPRIYLSIPRRKLGVLLAALPVLFYVWLGGFTPSLVRAAVMFACFGGLLLLGRPRAFLDGLFVALALILVASPLTVFDIGLQMSALAVAGIIIAVPPAIRFVQLRLPLYGSFPRLAHLIAGGAGILAASLSASVALLPVTLSAFGEIAAGLYWNLLWLPLLSFIFMPFGFLGLLLAGVGADTAAHWLFTLDAHAIEGFIGLLDMAKDLGLMPVWVGIRPPWPSVFGYYLFLVWLAGLAFRRGRCRAWPGLAAMLLLVGPLLPAELGLAGNGVSLTMLDVGQGQAVVVQAPDGRRWLIDGGGTFSRTFDIGRAVVAPALTQGRSPVLAGVALSHPQRDHAGGLGYILGNFDVGAFVSNGEGADTEVMRDVADALGTRSIPVEVCRAGDRIDLGDGALLEVLYPPPGGRSQNPNNTSLAFRLVWKGRGLALIPGDLEAEALRELSATGADLRADILVLPHHGSDSSYLPEFYERVEPKAALASCGNWAPRIFPGEKVRRAFGGLGLRVWNTAEQGTVRAVWKNADGCAAVSGYEDDFSLWRIAYILRQMHFEPESEGICELVR